MSPGQDGLFRMVHSQDLRRRVGAMIQQAIVRGIDQDVAQELHAIEGRLAASPEDWGEERGELRFLGLKRRHRITRMFHVLFAVDSVRRIVYVENYSPLTAYEFLDPH